MTRMPAIPRSQRGIAMIEVLVAILLLGIGVLGTIGLQGRSYRRWRIPACAPRRPWPLKN